MICELDKTSRYIVQGDPYGRGVVFVDCSVEVMFFYYMKLVQRPKKWLVRGLVKFVTAVARLVCLNLLG